MPPKRWNAVLQELHKEHPGMRRMKMKALARSTCGGPRSAKTLETH